MAKIFTFDNHAPEDEEKLKLLKSQIDDNTISVIESMLDGTPGLLITEVPTKQGFMNGQYYFNLKEGSFLQLFASMAMTIMCFLTKCHNEKDRDTFLNLLSKYAPKTPPEYFE